MSILSTIAGTAIESVKDVAVSLSGGALKLAGSAATGVAKGAGWTVDKLWEGSKKVGSAAFAALDKWKKAKVENKDIAWHSRLKLAISSFLQEMGLIKKEEEKVKAEAKSDVKTGIDETMDSAKENLGIKKEEELAEDAQQSVAAFWGAFSPAVKELKAPEQEAVKSGLDKVKDKHAKGNKDAKKLSKKESVTLTGVTLKSLLRLRKDGSKIRSEEELRGIFETLIKKSPVVKGFLQDILFDVESLGTSKEGMRLLKDYDMPLLPEGLEFKGLLEKFAGDKLEGDDEKKLISIMKHYFFKNTDDDDKIRDSLAVIKGVMSKKALEASDLATLATKIDERDLDHLANFMLSYKEED